MPDDDGIVVEWRSTTLAPVNIRLGTLTGPSYLEQTLQADNPGGFTKPFEADVRINNELAAGGSRVSFHRQALLPLGFAREEDL